MSLTRRETFAVLAGSAVLLSGALPLHAGTDEAEAEIAAFTGGAEPQPGRVSLTAPAVAENGNAVSITVEVDSAMDGDDRVESVLIVADGNPRADVAVFHFSALSGAAVATTRIRLAQSQTVSAVAKMADGTFLIDRKAVEVAIGGCTG